MRLFRRPDGRYYAIYTPIRDLLGDEVIVTIHGSSNNHLGGIKTYLMSETSVERLVKFRERRGYTEVLDEACNLDMRI